MKSTKRSLLASGASLLLSAALLAGSTFAWFTDSVTNTGNTIQAGSLKVNFEYKDLVEDEAYQPVPEDAATAGKLFTKEIWEPGYSYGYDFKVSNTGSLALDWELSFQNIVCTDGTNGAEIADVLDVYVLPVNATSLEGATPIGTLSQLENGVVKSGEDLIATTGTEEFSVVLKMQEGANNDYQKAKVTFDVYLRAKQATVEEDGFGNNTYDENAVYEQINVEANGTPAENGIALQKAVEEASEGAVVYVGAGDYQLPQDTYSSLINGDLKYGLKIDKSITLEGTGNVTISGDVNGYNSGMILFTKYDVDVTIDGFNFESGAWDIIGCDDPGVKNVTITNCEFKSTSADATPIKLKLLEGTIANNKFIGTDCGYGIRIIGIDKRPISWNGSVPAELNVDIDIMNNDFSGFGVKNADRGVVHISTVDKGNVTIFQNDFSNISQSFVVKNDNSVASINASGNYWGNESNLSAIKELVSGSVAIENYYSDAAMTQIKAD